MSKYSTIELWNKYYGKQEDVCNFTRLLMKKSACGNPNSKFHPTLDHIRPLSKRWFRCSRKYYNLPS